MVDRLNTENKSLKEYKPGSTRHTTATAAPPKAILSTPTEDFVSRELYATLKTEYDKMQNMYTDVVSKLSSLQMSLSLQANVCTQCRVRRGSPSSEETTDENMREKLIEKSRLLEKAKGLLTRAAAKEKNLRDQVQYLRRRCSELQNVPVILEEASE